VEFTMFLAVICATDLLTFLDQFSKYFKLIVQAIDLPTSIEIMVYALLVPFLLYREYTLVI